MGKEKKYKGFKDFYPYYLTEHADPTCREFHFTGTLLFFVILFVAPVFGMWWAYLLLPVVGYGFAWAGHFFFEKNKPATFQYPLLSLGSDFIMFYHILTNQIDDKLAAAHQKLGTQPK